MSEQIKIPESDESIDENLEEEPEQEYETPPPAKKYKCKYCDFESSDQLEVARHTRVNHPQPSSRKYTCKICGFEATTPLEIANHMRLAHKKGEPTHEIEKPEKQISIDEMTEDEIRTKIALEGRTALNQLKRKRLEEVLSKHPKVSPQAREWILFKWDTDESIHDDPQKLTWSMMNTGLPDIVAYEITSTVWQLENKYGHLLQQKPPYYFGYQEQQPIIPPPILSRQQQTQPTTSPFTPYQQYQMQQPMQPPSPYYTMPPPTPSYELYELKAEISKLKETLMHVQKGSSAAQQEKVVTINEPLVDNEGKYIVDDNGQIITIPVQLPISVLPTYLSMRKTGGQKTVEPESTKMQIDLLKERLEKLEQEKKDLEEKYLSTKDEMYKMQIQSLREQIQGAQTQMTELMKAMRTTPSGEYKRDEFKLLADSMVKLTEVVSERKPIEKLLQFAVQQKPQTPEEVIEQEQQAESLIEKELKNRGIIKE